MIANVFTIWCQLDMDASAVKLTTDPTDIPASLQAIDETSHHSRGDIEVTRHIAERGIGFANELQGAKLAQTQIIVLVATHLGLNPPG